MTPPASTEPNPFRCETCDLHCFSKKGDAENCQAIKGRYIGNVKKELKKAKDELWFWTSRIGCCLHPDATKAEQRIADVKRFNPSTWNCPNSCLCPMCLDERDCEIPCEEYIKMARGCEDGCEHCKVKALLREKGG